MSNFFEQDSESGGTKGLVFVGDKVLVYRRDTKTNEHPLYIDLPGGGAKADETPFETFKREIQEEFGLIVEQSDITYAKRYDNVKNPRKFGWFAVAKLPKDTQKQIKFGDEGLAYMLLNLDEYLELKDAWPVYQQRAKEYTRSLE